MKFKDVLERLLPKNVNRSFIHAITSGSMYKVSDIRSDNSVANIKAKIDIMRALAEDSQIDTALSYYATDATTVNTEGNIIWASPIDSNNEHIADIVNKLLARWNVNEFARDHILELATVGNLYMPTSDLYKQDESKQSVGIAIDNNTIVDDKFDILPCYKLPPENVLHLYQKGKPCGYITEAEENTTKYKIFSEASIIHFSLGGLLGEYTIDVTTNNNIDTYDIKFAEPLMSKALQPTKTLNLLEDALLLSSLIRTVKFINVDCNGVEDETEIANILQQIKDAIEQQMSLNTNTGDMQSFLNPQSPNNLIYLPKVNGNDTISITDLNMAESTETDNKLLQYYQDKKLSVLGVPKEAMNFSSNEGLGGAGSVLSQRSAIYANALQRLKTAYIAGWRCAINTYFKQRGMSKLVDKFNLHMAEIVTTQSTITFEKRDAAISQASAITDLLQSLGVSDSDSYKGALVEILSEVLPVTSSEVKSWNTDISDESDEGGIM